MILRKPYAFLIKYFKVIHLILTLLLVYILYKSNKLFSFFDEYLSLGTYKVIDDLSNIYIGPYVYLSIFSAIIISIIIFMLMRKKEKPIKYYVVLVVYYIALVVGLLFASSQLDNIGNNVINVMALRICRDVLLVLFLAQIPFVLTSLVRSVGFNIKKFNFQRDLMELEVDSKDNEEFELDVDIDSNDVKTRFRRRLRIIGYVLKENKIMVMTLIGLVLIIVGTLTYKFIYIENKTYKEEETFTANGLNITVLSSYQLDTDLFGNDISSGKYSYTVVRVKVKNLKDIETKVSTKNFTLKIGKELIYNSSIKEKESFIPLGNTDEIISLSNSEEKIFIVIFKVDKMYKNKEKMMEYAGSYKIDDGERIYNIQKIKLSPRGIKNKKEVKKVKLGETLNFSESILNNTNITINSFEIENKFMYSYKQCMGVCYTFNDYIVTKNKKYNTTIMKLDMSVHIDEKIYNYRLLNNLIPSIGHIRYVLNGKEYNQNFNIDDITPSVVKTHKYFEVKKEVKDAEKVYLDFIILDKVYIYVLKEA